MDPLGRAAVEATPGFKRVAGAFEFCAKTRTPSNSPSNEDRGILGSIFGTFEKSL